jgi:hypothetical protein
MTKTFVLHKNANTISTTMKIFQVKENNVEQTIVIPLKPSKDYKKTTLNGSLNKLL